MPEHDTPHSTLEPSAQRTLFTDDGADDLTEDIKRVFEEIDGPLTKSEYREHGEYSPTTIRNRFGSWNGMKHELGLELAGPYIATEELVEDLQRVFEEIDGPLTRAEYDEHGEYSSYTVKRRFESWTDAKREAGVTDRHPSVTVDDLITDIERVASEVDGALTLAEYLDHGAYTAATIMMHFDSWNDVCNAVGDVVESVSDGPEVTTSDIAADINRVASEVDGALTQREYDEHGEYSDGTVNSLFGSWNDMKDELGLELAGPYIATDDLTEDLQRVFEEIDGPLTQREYREHGEYSSWTVWQRFGSWNEMKHELGLEVTGPHIATEELIEDLHRVASEVDGPLTFAEYDEHGEYNPMTVRRRFGSWNEMKHELGLEVTGPRIATEELIEDLHRVASEVDGPLTVAEYDEHGEYSHTPIWNRFGSWNDMKDELGLTSPHSPSRHGDTDPDPDA